MPLFIYANNINSVVQTVIFFSESFTEATRDAFICRDAQCSIIITNKKLISTCFEHLGSNSRYSEMAIS